MRAVKENGIKHIAGLEGFEQLEQLELGEDVETLDAASVEKIVQMRQAGHRVMFGSPAPLPRVCWKPTLRSPPSSSGGESVCHRVDARACAGGGVGVGVRRRASGTLTRLVAAPTLEEVPAHARFLPPGTRRMSERDPIFFAEAADFRAWLDQHHASADQLWVGYYKRATGKPSVTWEETVDEALCYGWIDGIRKSRDDATYVIRFTPRSPKSVWSQRNIEQVEGLSAEGRMKPAGLAAFAHKDAHPDSGYRASDTAELPDEMIERFKSNPQAWAFYEEQPSGYRRQTARWVTDAKREETRQRRLSTLIEDSANGLRIKQLRRA